MNIGTSSFLNIAIALSLFGSVIDPAFGAPIDEALKTLRGLSAKERLTRVENEARKDAVRDNLDASSLRYLGAKPDPIADRLADPFA